MRDTLVKYGIGIVMFCITIIACLAGIALFSGKSLEPFNGIIQGLFGVVMLIVGYYFGSSSSSADKTELLAKAKDALPSASEVVPLLGIVLLLGLGSCRLFKTTSRDARTADTVLVHDSTKSITRNFDSTYVRMNDTAIKVAGASSSISIDSLVSLIDFWRSAYNEIDKSGQPQGIAPTEGSKLNLTAAAVVDNGRFEIARNGSSSIVISKGRVECKCDSLQIVVNDLRSVIHITERERDSLQVAIASSSHVSEVTKVVEPVLPWYQRIWRKCEGVFAWIGVVAVLWFLWRLYKRFSVVGLSAFDHPNV